MDISGIVIPGSILPLSTDTSKWTTVRIGYGLDKSRVELIEKAADAQRRSCGCCNKMFIRGSDVYRYISTALHGTDEQVVHQLKDINGMIEDEKEFEREERGIRNRLDELEKQNEIQRKELDKVLGSRLEKTIRV